MTPQIVQSMTQIILSHIWADNADIEIGFPGSGKVLQILNLDGLTIHNAKSNFPCLLAEVSCQQFYRCGLWGQSILAYRGFLHHSIALGKMYTQRHLTDWCKSFSIVKVAIKNIWKIHQQCLFPEINTRVLEIIHRVRCEQFNVGTN